MEFSTVYLKFSMVGTTFDNRMPVKTVMIDWMLVINDIQTPDL